MRKITSVIPVVLIFAIFIFLFIYMCLPQKPSDTVFTFSMNFLFSRGLYCATLGGILMTAFYHFTLYIFETREIAYLYFTIWCLTCVAVFFFIPQGLNDMLGWIPQGVLLTKTRDMLIFLFHVMLCAIGLHIFLRRFMESHGKVLITYAIVGAVYICLVPISVSFYKAVLWGDILAVSILITAIAFRSPELRKNKWTWLFVASFILLIVFPFTNQVVFANQLFLPGLVISLTVMLSQSVLLSKNYIDAFKFVEETKTNLALIVDERTKDLQNTNNAMKELVGNISHDLKTPLAVMSLNLEELSNFSQTITDENYTRCVRTAYQKNLDLQRLIQNLMEASRIETAQNQPLLEWISLSDLLSQTQDKYDDYLKGKGIYFEISYTGNAEIYTDPQRIWRVFDNIIYNAARYTAEDGTVTVHAAVSERMVTITVSDTGCGISPEHLPHIFEKFYKADPSRGTGGDSGLGLYIVRSIMEASGGTVTAKSEIGKGTGIILCFEKK